MEKIFLYDTTLRDGMQGENIFFSPEDKVKIAKRLDDAGIHYIEGGWPGSNPGAQHFFELAKDMEFKNAKVAAFGSTRRPGKTCEQDANIQALIESGAPVITIFGKSWDLHVESIMQNTKEENLAMIKESIKYLLKHDREVIYDAEHFFDGYKAKPDYALKTLEAAVEGGTKCLVLCDTNGGSMPCEIESITKTAIEHFKEKPDLIFGIHTHDDCAMAVANSVTAVHAGATMVQGTINGYGERCGNADLTAIIPILALKMNRDCMNQENLKRLLNLSRFISETANVPPVNSRPFVGKSAFAHKGGVHVSAIMKNPRAYEHISPDLVGNIRRVIVSEQSGKSNIEYKAKELGIDIGKNGANRHQIVSSIKELEDDGFEFDAAEGSLKLIMEKLTNQFTPHFELESFRVVVEKDKERPCYSHAMIKIRVGNETEITSAEGDGPVSALDNALRKALTSIYPQINDMHLVDFKVRVIDGMDGTDAKVRVLIESRDKNNIFSTIGVSEDIIEASWQALADSFQYKLSLDNKDIIHNNKVK
ncbi:MAG: citramalate synthase [Desulfobacula sp.]|uniref:citramalate synthase n=1 Tax=Desulfobacula sp. TaxID=2593537 RepID=UPI001E0D6813|nr:citramalate synthase [Desulfobacula sp.]MBT3487270.1 citramalate synthase [Desulfobacula sp.]MBT3806366.1 citramalate synthase [Desulfobacula sp.]MBT4025917.1 citramalate synthase [Desulfobacula sp.]MBT4200916.1 citramalate synthase [Desulfobacula sp.]